MMIAEYFFGIVLVDEVKLEEYMELPQKFQENMKALLGENGFSDYLNSFAEKRVYGLRINPLKITKEHFLEKNIFSVKSIPWCDTGLYYEEMRPAKHPYYFAGLYYLQEPSAMSPAAVLPIEVGDRVLDVCAAPGGKSTQLAGRMGQSGVLVANDISTGRMKPLAKNVQMAGIKNAVLINEPPRKLVERFRGYFDKILIDAPCSGEGMFRKETDMVKSWNEELIDFCINAQGEILSACGEMLRPGGMLVYATCTFSPLENESTIQKFLMERDDFEIVPISEEWGFQKGRPDMIEKGIPELKGCARLYPHKLQGEGHFLALLRKKEGTEITSYAWEETDQDKRLEYFQEFAEKSLESKWEGVFKIYGDELYLLPQEVPILKGLRVLRSGWHLGTFKKSRFEPSQHFAMGLQKDEVKRVVDFPLTDDRVIRYLKGETVNVENIADDWCLVCVDGFSLGWGKMQKGRLKNKYYTAWKWE